MASLSLSQQIYGRNQKKRIYTQQPEYFPRIKLYYTATTTHYYRVERALMSS